jgi:hypothetical protein
VSGGLGDVSPVKPALSSISPMKNHTSAGRNIGTPGLRNSQAGFDNMMSEQDRIVNSYIQQFGEELVKSVTESIAF